MRNILLITSLIIIGLLTSIKTQGADWKFYGAGGDKNKYFYDSESVKYISDGNLRVWGETANLDFSEICKENQKKISARAFNKDLTGYDPPYTLVTPKMTPDDRRLIGIWEEIANSYEIHPPAKSLYEINCKNKKIRTLQGTIYNNNGGVKSETKIHDWGYIVPESNGETLQKILCK